MSKLTAVVGEVMDYEDTLFDLSSCDPEGMCGMSLTFNNKFTRAGRGMDNVVTRSPE